MWPFNVARACSGKGGFHGKYGTPENDRKLHGSPMQTETTFDVEHHPGVRKTSLGSSSKPGTGGIWTGVGDCRGNEALT